MDDALQALERRWLTSKDPADHARWIASAVRAGLLDEDLAREAAVLGHPAAREALGVSGAPPHRVGEWLDRLDRRMLEPRAIPGDPGRAAALDRARHALWSRAGLAAARALVEQWDGDRQFAEEEDGVGERPAPAAAAVVEAFRHLAGPGRAIEPLLGVTWIAVEGPAWLENEPALCAFAEALRAFEEERGCGLEFRAAIGGALDMLNSETPEATVVEEVGAWLLTHGPDGPPHALRPAARPVTPSRGDARAAEGLVARVEGGALGRDRVELAALLGDAPARLALERLGVAWTERSPVALLERTIPGLLEGCGVEPIARAALGVARYIGERFPRDAATDAKLAAVEAWLRRPSVAKAEVARRAGEEVPIDVASHAAFACGAKTPADALDWLRRSLDGELAPADEPKVVDALRAALVPWLLSDARSVAPTPTAAPFSDRARAPSAGAGDPGPPVPPPPRRGWLRRLLGL